MAVATSENTRPVTAMRLRRTRRGDSCLIDCPERGRRGRMAPHCSDSRNVVLLVGIGRRFDAIVTNGEMFDGSAAAGRRFLGAEGRAMKTGQPHDGVAGALPLKGLRVLDLTLARAGPTCVRHLADWGADVIRVEPPPSAGESNEIMGRRDGSDFQNLHRNKRAITLNLKTDQGREILMRLAEKADVVIENMRPGVTKPLGVDYEAVRKRNPKIVYGRVSGFGQYGPYTSRPSIDQIAQGMSGIMSVTGIPGQGPVRVGVAVTDIMAGAFLAQGVLIALLDREVSGEGRWVQTSLMEAGITLLDFQATRWLMDKKIPPQEGNYHPTAVPMGLYPT